MASQKPLVLVDNLFDRINLYPLASLIGTTGLAGREFNYLADYRRERTYYQAAAAAAGQFVEVDLGVGNTALPDACWIDRGHNLWGKDVRIYMEDVAFGGGAAQSSNTGVRVVPAQGTVGGDPTVGWCVTEEGAIYTVFTHTVAAQRYHTIYFPGNFQPLLTGVVLGKRVQLLGYSSVVDEDSGDRNVRSESSLIPGYSGDDRSYSARMVEIKLSLIGAAEYDSSIRTLRRLLFDLNQPAVVCMNYGTYPERAWLYKYQGNRWNSPTSRTRRSAKIPLYEYGPLIR
jgi:hypothetical protein